MYKKGKERVATVFGSKIFQDGKEAILDTAEEGFIRAYNLGQKVNDKFFKFGRKNKTEEENSDKQKIYEQEPISEEEKKEINKFETNIDRVNRIQKEQNRKNPNKYMEIYLKENQAKNGLKDIQIVKEEQEHYLERNFLINKKV